MNSQSHNIEYFKRLFEDSDPQVRMDAILELGESHIEGAFELLVTALGDEKEDAVFFAAHYLASSQDLRAVKPLTALLKGETRFTSWGGRLKVYIVMSLGTINSDSIIEPMLGAFADDDDEVGYWSAKALTENGNIHLSASQLIEVLASENINARFHALSALAGISDPQAIESIISMLNDSDKRVRSNAAQTLGELKDRRATKPLISALASEDPGLVNASIRALGDIGDVEAIEPLANLLRQGRPTNITQSWFWENARYGACEALGKIADVSALPILEWVSKNDRGKTMGGVPVKSAAFQAMDSINSASGKLPYYEPHHP